MTPAARFAAAIDVLDIIFDGAPAERTLTTWARKNRFAGSKDRAAIRDHVYDVLRAKRSLGALGGGTSARATILGLVRRSGIDPSTVFGAAGYGPEALSPSESATGGPPKTDAECADLPDWLWPIWQASLGADAMTVAQGLRARAPVYLRVNLSRGTRDDVVHLLAEDGIASVPLDCVNTALKVTENARKVAQSRAYNDGLIEVQDTASQIAMCRLSVPDGARVLDYCAGGGGKALALADRTQAHVFAHDIDVSRTADIAPRAARAGVRIDTLGSAELTKQGPFDLVLCDAPCSGSGTWRRTPDAKWRLTPADLTAYGSLQAQVLSQAAKRVAPGGTLAYATCSVLGCENGQIVDSFVTEHPQFSQRDRMQLLPDDTHDGFFLATFELSQP